MLAVAQWLIHIFSSVCCLLPCASVVVFLAFDVMLINAKRVPSAGSCFEGSDTYKCTYTTVDIHMCVCLYSLVTQSQQWLDVPRFPQP